MYIFPYIIKVIVFERREKSFKVSFLVLPGTMALTLLSWEQARAELPRQMAPPLTAGAGPATPASRTLQLEKGWCSPFFFPQTPKFLKFIRWDASFTSDLMSDAHSGSFPGRSFDEQLPNLAFYQDIT